MNEDTRNIALLLHIADLISRQSDQMLQERLGIGLTQYKVLEQISLQDGVTQREVAELLFQTEPAVSRQVALLGAKDLIVRRTNKGNRREYNLFITTKGAKLYEAANEVLVIVGQRVLGDIPAKQRKAVTVLHEAMHATMCRSKKCTFLSDSNR